MNPLLLWQLIDSSFPSGGFAHSAGLEAAWQAGEVANDESLRQFMHDNLWQTGRAVLPLVSAAHREPGRWEELDEMCDAFLINAVANRASRVQGRALLAACGRIWPSADLAELEARARTLCGHHAPIVGATFHVLGVPLPLTERVTLFVACRSLSAAAVRLGIVGPYRAQRLQDECAPVLDEVLQRCGGLDVEQLAQTAPLVDVLQAAHDRLYSRLFQS
jgi:urease accessory protein